MAKSKSTKEEVKEEVKICEACEGTGLKAINEVCPICNPEGKGSFVE